MSELKAFLQTEISKTGFVHIGDYMAYTLGHPTHGYYMKQDPFGVAGDFTTAPEISQIFGEIIGAWVVDVWEKMGQPAEFTLLECGPGRGTLMADMLRVGAMVPGFLAACKVCLLEMSPVLKDAQAEALANISVQCDWVISLDDVPRDRPVIVIGNEFLDALPVRQLEKTAHGWSERVVSMVGQNLGITTQSAPADLVMRVPKALTGCKQGEIVEVSEAREHFMRALAGLLDAAGGAGLLVDYGHDVSAAGDTLQAVHKHEYVGVLDHVGDADVSSHVDFSVMMDVVGDGALTYQGHFLKALGAHVRAERLKDQAQDADQRAAVEPGYKRLVDADQMGRLFKVMGFVKGYDFELAGFQN